MAKGLSQGTLDLLIELWEKGPCTAADLSGDQRANHKRLKDLPLYVERVGTRRIYKRAPPSPLWQVRWLPPLRLDTRLPWSIVGAIYWEPPRPKIYRRVKALRERTPEVQSKLIVLPARVDATPFLEWLDEWKTITGASDVQAGLLFNPESRDNGARSIRRIRATNRVSVALVDEVLIRAGIPGLLEQLTSGLVEDSHLESSAEAG